MTIPLYQQDWHAILQTCEEITEHIEEHYDDLPEENQENLTEKVMKRYESGDQVTGQDVYHTANELGLRGVDGKY